MHEAPQTTSPASAGPEASADAASPAAPPEAPREGWTDVGEQGGVLAIRAAVFVATFLGRGFGRLIASVVAFYYWLFARSARRAAAVYLEKLHGRPATSLEVYRQILRFAQTTLDAFFFVAGKTNKFRVTTNGHHHLEALARSGRGAILLGAHLGSFYAMRAQSDVESLPLYAVVYTKNAKRINEAFERIDPGKHAKLLQMGEGIDFMLRIKELVEGGAIVAILADRVPPEAGNDGRTASAQFLGASAKFPTGPYLLASMLKCPVYLTCGLYRGGNHYDLHCEPFADAIVLPRKGRTEALAGYAQQYASRLERFVRLAPDNWFNFYDFWER